MTENWPTAAGAASFAVTHAQSMRRPASAACTHAHAAAGSIAGAMRMSQRLKTERKRKRRPKAALVSPISYSSVRCATTASESKTREAETEQRERAGFGNRRHAAHSQTLISGNTSVSPRKEKATR
jgi:hypothetical protein